MSVSEELGTSRRRGAIHQSVYCAVMTRLNVTKRRERRRRAVGGEGVEIEERCGGEVNLFEERGRWDRKRENNCV